MTPTALDTYPLTEDEIASYRANGFLQLHGVLTPEELAAARQDLDEAMGMSLSGGLDRTGIRSDYDRVFLQKVNLWRDHAGIKRLVTHPRLAELARRLAGVEAIRLWHDHALIKPHTESKASPWHQDLPYWPMEDPEARGCLSCWLALDDVDATNGAMSFVPESHSWGKLEPINLVTPQDIFSLVPEPEGKDFTPAPQPMSAGSCTFHNGLTFHHAPPNRGNAPRRALVIIFMPDGVRYSGKPHPVTDGQGFTPGEPLAGDLFPILATTPP
jgi:ectoine hydroxylase-related dioxygenase (phytanoyl-CoA dioxygenase family)